MFQTPIVVITSVCVKLPGAADSALNQHLVQPRMATTYFRSGSRQKVPSISGSALLVCM